MKAYIVLKRVGGLWMSIEKHRQEGLAPGHVPFVLVTPGDVSEHPNLTPRERLQQIVVRAYGEDPGRSRPDATHHLVIPVFHEEPTQMLRYVEPPPQPEGHFELDAAGVSEVRA